MLRFFTELNGNIYGLLSHNHAVAPNYSFLGTVTFNWLRQMGGKCDTLALQ